jgi:predicted MFS family arabinose efflux permease
MIFIPSENRRHLPGKKARIFSIKEMFRHRIVLGLFIMRFFTASGQGAVYTFLPILALQLNLTSSQVGIILGANIFLIAFFCFSFNYSK